MGKKRKVEDRGLDEADIRLYQSFCTAANFISQLYTQAQSQQDLAFQQGEQHCAGRLYQWLSSQQSESVPIEEIRRFLQGELDASSGDQGRMSSQPINSPAAQQQPQSLPSVNQIPSEGFEPSGLGLESRPLLSDENRLAFFPSNFPSLDGSTIPSFGLTQLQDGHASVQYSLGNSGWQAETTLLEQHQETLPNQMASEVFEPSGLGLESRAELSDQILSNFSSPNQGMIPPFGLSQLQGGHASMQYGLGNLGWRAEPTLEQHQGTPSDGTYDSVFEHYNSSTIISHQGATLSTYSPRVTHSRSDHSYGEHDTSMEMHMDGDFDTH
ncbi:hypothetical protein O6H91_08G095000 [Diphasiastrum complanatum]|uniref:Uncharacterized protein n=1 Tax=Diphasiastrum complanatum TaxID=34168 RepID=A0ACC2D0D1_DIPCM|nr:hypothetical protein O6H91_08G095000 [Diphasiastrum complanatum]